MIDLVPCDRCRRQVPRWRSLSGRHLCHGEEREEDELLASLENGLFLIRIADWRENNVEGRLRREYITWREAGCPPWDVWRSSTI